MAAKQAMKENLQCTSKYGHLRISQDICHVRMTDIEGFLTIYGHSDNLLNNKPRYVALVGILISMHGFNFLKCSVTPYFLLIDHFLCRLPTVFEKLKKVCIVEV